MAGSVVRFLVGRSQGAAALVGAWNRLLIALDALFPSSATSRRYQSAAASKAARRRGSRRSSGMLVLSPSDVWNVPTSWHASPGVQPSLYALSAGSRGGCSKQR